MDSMDGHAGIFTGSWAVFLLEATFLSANQIQEARRWAGLIRKWL